MNRQSTPLEEIFTKCRFILRTHKNSTQQQKNLNKYKLSQTLVQHFTEDAMNGQCCYSSEKCKLRQ